MNTYTILLTHTGEYDAFTADSPEAALKLWHRQRRDNVGAVACYVDGQENHGPNFWVYFDEALGTVIELYADGPGTLSYKDFVCIGAGWARRHKSAHCSIWLGDDGKWHWLAYDDALMQQRGAMSSGRHGFTSSGEAYEALVRKIAGPNCPLYINLTLASACLCSLEGVWRWDATRRAWVHPRNTNLAIEQVSIYWRWAYTADAGTEREETFQGAAELDPVSAGRAYIAWAADQPKEAVKNGRTHG